MKPARDLIVSSAKRGADALLGTERACAFEGEMRWCPMLAAQYVILHRLVDRPIDEARALRALRYFEHSRVAGGTWGLHDHAGPSLYVTTLVYVAARLLGAPANAPWLAPARVLFATERVERVPTWGRVWLALLGLYRWQGVLPMPPEAWALPEALPVHPSRYYPHTRMIYLALSLLWAAESSIEPCTTLASIREELYGERRFARIDFRAHRGDVSELDLVAKMPRVVATTFDALGIIARWIPGRVRAAVTRDLRSRIRYELRTTDYLGISPVSGMLGVLALSAHDATDPAIERTLASLETWVFEDETVGFRVTGARSQTWDTSFAIQALAASTACPLDAPALVRSARWLAAQQIRAPLIDADHFHRVDPVGGFCFAHREHGWPVSDCTAEALIALLEIDDATLAPHVYSDAVRFILRCQNHDGGFGSYEKKRVRGSIDFLNPSEMFLECMTEDSYVECTASSLMALVAFRAHDSSSALASEVDTAITRATRFLRSAQRPDGSWTAAWGIHFLYGTMFGVRGLRAAGVASDDPAIVRSVAFLVSVQHPDGGFAEHESGSLTDRFVDVEEGHPVQTSWALLALSASGVVGARPAMHRAADYLRRTQTVEGAWPSPRMVGCFFRTSLVDYTLYRFYFPVWALGSYLRATEEIRPAISDDTSSSRSHA